MEATRERLADTIDLLVYRSSPKTIARREIMKYAPDFRMNPLAAPSGSGSEPQVFMRP